MNVHPLDAYAARLLRDICLPLVAEARDDLEFTRRIIHGLDRADLENVAFILAALVPADARPSHLLAWLHPKPAQPCGDPHGWARHKRAGEDVCDTCREAKRQYDADCYRRRKAAA